MDLRTFKNIHASTSEKTYKHQELTEKIIGVFYSVYNELGFGFLESIYKEAMVLALAQESLSVLRDVPTPVYFRHCKIADFKADLLVSGLVILELKAVRVLEPCHEAQLLNYLRSTEIEIGLLLNFGPKPQVKRMAFDNNRKQISVHLRSSAAAQQ